MSGNLQSLNSAIVSLTKTSKPHIMTLPNLETEPLELMGLLERQSLSLESLESQWNFQVAQLASLEKTKNKLMKEQEQLLKNIKDLEQSLTALQTAASDLQAYNADLLNRLKQINKQYRNLIAAGIICGACLGAGLSMLTIGAVTARPGLTYSGLAIGGAAILTFSIGKITHTW